MAHVIYITGGQRSGKSSYAQKLALSLSETPVYLATSRQWDEGHQERIKRHQSDRGSEWENIEEEKYVSKHDYQGKVVLMDCVTLWLTNFFYDNNQDIEKSLEEAKDEFDKLVCQDFTLIIISNEIGMGGHPTHPVQMKFTDLQGWLNQYIGQQSNEAFMMVSGLPLKLK